MTSPDRQTHPRPPLAAQLDVARPRPQLVRDSYLGIDGEWHFTYDDENVGLAEGWFDGRPLGMRITVPFPPESVASGIGDTGFHPVLWYRREITTQHLDDLGYQDGMRLLVHFGAVDYRAEVWLNGENVGSHEGGHTPFTLDLTNALKRNDGVVHVLTVRAEDDPHDLTQPRGKQDWKREPHTIWYHRTSGIWQPVWLEAVPAGHITDVFWRTDLAHGTVTATVEVSPSARGNIHIDIAHEGAGLGSARTAVSGRSATVTFDIVGQDNGQAYERLLWRPGSANLIDATVTFIDDHGVTDVISSYFGLRSVDVAHGQFLLNDRPIVLRSVLSQGYWPDTHLAAPSDDALRREAQLILDLGFNAVRVHQKVEDDRFLYWADRLGLLVWGETAAAYSFDHVAVQRTVSEWTEAVLRDRSHPCIVTWVPLNESWGVQHIAARPDQRALAETLYHLTKTLDQSRPVISNDGWEHGTTDLWTIHDYEADGDVLHTRYNIPEAQLRHSLTRIGPAGRRVRLAGAPERDQPIMLTEFGGVKWAADAVAQEADAWGYSEASSSEDFEARVRAILEAVQVSSFGYAGRSEGLAGWCWTQLTDTMQECNGLVTAAREPKLPLATLRAMIREDAQ